MKRSIRVRSVILCFALIISLFNFLERPVFAASVTTIKSFSKDLVLNKTQYDTLRTGTISATKLSDGWYYVFKKGSTELRVKATAFSGTVANSSFSKVNKQLTAGVNSTDGIWHDENYIYKARNGKANKQGTYADFKRLKTSNVTINIYNTYFSSLTLSAKRNGTFIDLQCKANNHVQFTYNDKINVRNRNESGYRAPKTQAECLKALVRTTGTVSKQLTPVFDLKVTRPGDNRVCLADKQYFGKGIANTSTNVSSLISVGVSTVKLAKSATFTGGLKNLYSLYKDVKKLSKNGSEYYTSSQDKIKLSWKVNGKAYYCYEEKSISPIKLQNNGDYFRSEICLSKKPSTSGTKTVFSVTFSI